MPFLRVRVSAVFVPSSVACAVPRGLYLYLKINIGTRAAGPLSVLTEFAKFVFAQILLVSSLVSEVCSYACVESHVFVCSCLNKRVLN